MVTGQDTFKVMNGKKEIDSIVVRTTTLYGNAGMPDQNFGNGIYDGWYTISDSVIVKGKKGRNSVIDSIYVNYIPTAYMVDKVEQMIIDEMALETAFEGHRFYDLMRFAMRREDPSFLADKVARRAGEEAGRDEALFNKLNDPTYDSWYLHKK
jgi:hypothetical protein